MSLLRRLKSALVSALLGLEGGVVRLAQAGLSVLLVPLILGVALGAGLFLLTHPSLFAALDTNKIPVAERARALHWLFGALGGVAGFYTIVIAIRRIVERKQADARLRVLETAGALNRYLLGLVALPLVVVLAQKDFEKNNPKLCIFFALAAAALIGRSLYALFEKLPLPKEPDEQPAQARKLRQRLKSALAGLSVVAIGAVYAYFFSRLAITHHHGLGTRTIDLGYYDNIFYQSLHGHPLGCSFIKAGNHSSAHFDPILIALAQIYRFYPRAELLLVLQSVWLSLGVIPAYLLGRKLLESRAAGITLALVYVAYPALHGANMYEFHSLTLITPVLLALVLCLETGKTWLYFALMVVALSIREDVPLLLCFVGLYAILTPKGRRVRTGIATIVLSLGYFVLVKAVFMQSSGVLNTGDDAYSFEYYYDAMIPDRNGIGGLILSIVTNPVFALRLALEEAKVVFLAQIFVPLMFLPFLARWGRVMLIYGLLFCLLASRGAVFAIHFQYASILIPLAIALVPIALRQLRDGTLRAPFGMEPRRLSSALLGACLVATVLVSWKFGGATDNATFKGGFARIIRSLSEEQVATYEWVNEQTATIPEGASVSTTNRLGAHVSNRMRAYFYPQQTKVDYLFLDEGELKQPQLDGLKKSMNAGDFREISRRGKLVLLKRRGL